MIGLALLAVGAVALWAAFTGRADAVLSALKMQLPTVGAGNSIVENPPASSGEGSGGNGGEGNGTDSGSHTGLTDGGLSYIINKAYGDMTDQEKHDANNFAHQQDNLGSA